MTRFFANANYDFIGFRKYAYGLTAAILVPGLIFLAIFGIAVLGFGGVVAYALLTS